MLKRVLEREVLARKKTLGFLREVFAITSAVVDQASGGPNQGVTRRQVLGLGRGGDASRRGGGGADNNPTYFLKRSGTEGG